MSRVFFSTGQFFWVDKPPYPCYPTANIQFVTLGRGYRDKTMERALSEPKFRPRVTVDRKKKVKKENYGE